MDTPSFMTDIQTLNPSDNNTGSAATSHQGNSVGGGGDQHIVCTAASVDSSSPASIITTTTPDLSAQTSLQAQKVQPSEAPVEELPQISDSSSLPVAKVILPAQVVVAHPFAEQQVPQQSVLFQALTSHPASHFITVAVPGQDAERLEIQSSQSVSCVQYLDEGGGGGDTNVFSSPNGQMTTFFSSTAQPNMYTPNSTAYYNTTNSAENFSQAVVESSNAVVATGLDTSFTGQQESFHSVDENSVTDHENSQPACFPSSRLSAATMKWLMENYELADGMSVPRSTMYSHYLKHCTDCKMEPLNAASFGKLIRSVFAGLRTRRLGTRGNSKYHYYGIRLKPTSSINKNSDHMIIDSYRPSPFIHNIRRNKADHAVKIENNDHNEDHNSYDMSDSEKRRKAPSPNGEHYLFLGDVSTAIPSIDIEFNSLTLPDDIALEDIQQFQNAYHKHCEALLEAVVNFQFAIVETIWLEFWKSPVSHSENNDETTFSQTVLMKLGEWPPIQDFVKHTDYQFYQNLVEVLIPEVLRPIPSTLTQAIRNFAKNLEGWLKNAMADCCSELVNIKISAISAFAQTLRRYTSLNHLAQAARAVLQSTTQIKQMASDLSKVDFRNIQEQASWVCQCDEEVVQRLLGEFRQTLQQHLWLEEWAHWLENIVKVTLKPYENKPSYSKAARQFLLNWSFYSTLVIRDLTLRSAASFGSFHLLRLLYDEYMFYIIEHAIAKATGTTSLAVMGEYLCAGKPEELCGDEELKDENFIHDSIESNEVHLQNGCMEDNNVDSSLNSTMEQ